MDSLNLRLLFVFTDLVLPLIVGYTLHQRHLVNDKAITKLIKFNIVVISTVLSLLSFWVIPLSWDLLWVPACGFLLVLVPGLIGTVLFARRFPDMLDRGAYIASSMLTVSARSSSTTRSVSPTRSSSALARISCSASSCSLWPSTAT